MASSVNIQYRYSAVAMALHWAMAAILVPMLFLGGELIRAPSGSILPTLHASAGVTVLLLAIARIWWRLANLPPEIPAGTPALERAAAKLTHGLLYAMMILIPVSGAFAYSGYADEHPSNAVASFFGVLSIPSFGLLSSHLMCDIHGLLVNLTFGLVGLHVLAALKHQFVSRDGLFWRMLPL